MLGLVSFEDVLEELVGDIRDEFDIEKGPFFERSKDAVLVDADLPLRDLASETGWPLPTQTTETVEKWALRHWGRVPPTGDQLEIEGISAHRRGSRPCAASAACASPARLFPRPTNSNRKKKRRCDDFRAGRRVGPHNRINSATAGRLFNFFTADSSGRSGRSRSTWTRQRKPSGSSVVARNWCQVMVGIETRSFPAIS